MERTVARQRLSDLTTELRALEAPCAAEMAVMDKQIEEATSTVGAVTDPTVAGEQLPSEATDRGIGGRPSCGADVHDARAGMDGV